MSSFFLGMGAEIRAAVTTTHGSAVLEQVSANEVTVGDLDDFERLAEGAELLVAPSHGRQASERLGVPLLRVGFPIFDRLGSQHKCRVGYEGARDFIFEVANIFEGAQTQATPESLNPFRDRENEDDRCAAPATH
jgi:nitrogenase molybdenum-iron protein NifN